MRRIIQSLTPDAGNLYWKWVGAVFAFYVVALTAAGTMWMAHRSASDTSREPALAGAAGHGKQRSAPVQLKQLASGY
jgi:hypothetical protein